MGVGSHRDMGRGCWCMCRGVRRGMSALPVLACFKSPIFLVKVRHDAPVLRIRLL